MSDEQRLRDALADLVPPPPAAPDRASGARAHARRARRVRRSVVSVGVAAAVTVIVLPLALDGQPARGPLPVASPSPGVVPGNVDCPGPTPANLPLPPLEGPDELPGNAIAIRACFVGGLAWQAPQDALVTGATEVVQAINGYPPYPEPVTCSLDAGRTWAMVFQFADGHSQLVRGESFGCGGIQVGSATRGERDAAAEVWDLFGRLLLEQRAEAEPGPVDTTPPRCGSGGPLGDVVGLSWLPEPPGVDVAGARLCWWVDTDVNFPENAALLTRDDLAVIVKDLRANAGPQDPPTGVCDGTSRLALTVSTSWGDGLRFESHCGEVFALSWDPPLYWRPGPESRAIFDRIVAGQPSNLPTIDPDTKPDDVVAAWAYMFNYGATARSGQLWVDRGSQPEGRAVSVKVIGAAPYQLDNSAGASYDEVVQVRAEYRLLPLDNEVGVHEVGFILVRNQGHPWRILGINEGRG